MATNTKSAEKTVIVLFAHLDQIKAAYSDTEAIIIPAPATYVFLGHKQTDVIVKGFTREGTLKASCQSCRPVESHPSSLSA